MDPAGLIPTEKTLPMLSDLPPPARLSPPHDAERPPTNLTSTSSHEPAVTNLAKRAQALMELFLSERGYASDLWLILDVHIPMASGRVSYVGFPTSC